uniref:Uncharacterized protein n=1 Tax=Arundo donax TaxID=35708 RepID=A0A0A9EVV1_ARUDO
MPPWEVRTRISAPNQIKWRLNRGSQPSAAAAGRATGRRTPAVCCFQPCAHDATIERR